MALPSDRLTVSYQQIASIPIGTRAKMLTSGFADAFRAALTPGQIIALFPKDYRSGAFASGGTQVASLDSPSYTPPASVPGAPSPSSPNTGPYTPSGPGAPPKLSPADAKLIQNAGIQPGLSAPIFKSNDSPQASNRFFDAISQSEGTTEAQAKDHGFASPYDVPQGYGRFGMPPKPISSMTLAEAYAFGRSMIATNKTDSSALGRFQITGTTMKEYMEKAGLTWNDKFDATAQQRLTVEIAKGQGLGAWEGLKKYPDLMQVASQEMATGRAIPAVSSQSAEPLTPEQLAFIDAGNDAWNAAHPNETAVAVGSDPEMKAGDLALGITEGRSPDLTDIDPRLKEIVAAAATHLPPGYKATINDGFHEQGTDDRSKRSQHKVKGSGAIDVQIVDPAGNIVPNRGDDPTGIYKQLATHAKGEMLARYPELEGKLAYGGAFETSNGSGKADPMHFDLGGDRGNFRPSNQIANLTLDDSESYGVTKIIEDASGLHIANEITQEAATAEPLKEAASDNYTLDRHKAAEMVRGTPEFKEKAGIFGGMVSDDQILNDPGFKDAMTKRGITMNGDGTITLDKTVEAATIKEFTDKGIITPIGITPPSDVSAQATGAPTPVITTAAQAVASPPIVSAASLGASAVAPVTQQKAPDPVVAPQPPAKVAQVASPQIPAAPQVRPSGDANLEIKAGLNSTAQAAYSRAVGGDLGGSRGTAFV